MAQFKVFNKDVEVNGQTIFSIQKGLGMFADAATEIFTKHGLANIDPNGWYEQQKWLNCFEEIASEMGARTLFQIGMKIPESAEFPPDIQDAHAAVASIDIAYHMNHRLHGKVLFDPATGKVAEGIGNYQYQKVDDNTAKVICKNPYPCDFDKGIIQAMARRFEPTAIIEHLPGECRSKNGNTCQYQVSW